VTAAVQARCRCGELFCPTHMHAHRCAFDYKTKMKVQLPKVEPAKLLRIASSETA